MSLKFRWKIIGETKKLRGGGSEKKLRTGFNLSIINIKTLVGRGRWVGKYVYLYLYSQQLRIKNSYENKKA